jgi:hypothetical protein
MRWPSAVLLAMLTAACAGEPPQPDKREGAAVTTNPVVHFEIPVTDMDRAVAFYEHVLGHGFLPPRR